MNHWKGAVYLAGAFILAGTSVISAKIIGGSLSPFTIAAMSLLFALPALLLACRKKIAGHMREMRVREWLLAVLQAVFGIFVFRIFLLNGLMHTSAAEGGILTGATPAVTALLAGFILRERVNLPRAAGIACTVAGILLLQGLLLPESGFSASHLLGNLLVLLAAVSESIFNILSRVGAIHSHSGSASQDPAVQTAIVAVIAFLLCLIPALLERPAPALLALNWNGWAALVWYGLFITAAAFYLWYSGIRLSEASVAAAFSGMMPLTALVLSILLLGERPALLQWAGGLLVVAGMLLTSIQSEKLKNL